MLAVQSSWTKLHRMVSGHFFRTFPMDISPRMNRSIEAEITVINPTSIYWPLYFHQSRFHFNTERVSSNSFRSIFGLISSLLYVFAAQPRFLSSIQLLVNKELFHQSSWYLINIVSSVQLQFKQCSLHFSLVKCPGRKCPRPASKMTVSTAKLVQVVCFPDKRFTDNCSQTNCLRWQFCRVDLCRMWIDKLFYSASLTNEESHSLERN